MAQAALETSSKCVELGRGEGQRDGWVTSRRDLREIDEGTRKRGLGRLVACNQGHQKSFKNPPALVTDNEC